MRSFLIILILILLRIFTFAGSWVNSGTTDIGCQTVTVPQGVTNLTFTLTMTGGDWDLYVRGAGCPTTVTYDCRPYLSGTATETCGPYTASGSCGGGNVNYYAWARPYSLGGTWTLTVTWTDCPAPISSFPWCESFDGATFAPTNWANTQISGTGLWQRSTSGSYPTCSPHSGAGMAYYNSYSFASGTEAILVTPALNTSSGTYSVSFWMYRDNGYLSNTDLVNVYYNTSPNKTGATLLGTINRSINLAPVVGANGWYQYSYTLASSSYLYVIFDAVSAYGNNMFVDDVCVQSACSAPTSVTATSSVTSFCSGGGSVNFLYSTHAGGNPGSGTWEYQWENSAETVVRAWNAVSTFNTVIASTTTYHLHMRSTACTGSISPKSNDVTVTVFSAFSAGAMTGPASSSQCYNYNPTVLTANPTGGAGTYTYQWQSSPAGCAAWTDIGGATASTYDPPALTATTCYRVMVDATGSPDCGSATASTNTFTYTILTNFSAGAMTGPANSTQCYNYNPTVLTANPTGGAGTYTYQWQSSPAGCAAWSDIGGATASTYDPPALTATTCYRVMVDATGSPDCGSATASTNTFTYTILGVFSGGTITGGGGSFCDTGDPGVMTANPSGGAGTYAYQWYYKDGTGCPNTGGATLIAGATSQTYDPPSGLTVTRSYQCQVDATGSPDCGGFTWASNCITVTINISSTAPTSASANPTSIASGGSSTLTVSGGSLGTGASWTWHTGNCAGAIVGTGNPINVYPTTTTTYYVNAISACNTTTCVTVTVTVGSGLIGVINNGAVIYFKGSATSNAYMYIDGGSNGNFYNYTTGVNEGKIFTENNGTNGAFIKLEGSWYNYVNNGVFQMSVAPTTRDYNTTEFMGTNAQSIGGDYITYFYNLTKSGAGITTMNINTQVGGITALTGVFSLAGGPFNINGYLITITNPATTAVIRTAGYIQSTILDQAFNSRIQWNIGTTSGAHVFPFGTVTSYIPFTFNLAAGANCGNLTLSTYPTGGGDANTVYNNRPTIVANLNGINTGTIPPANAANIVRRFWSISPTVNPLTGGSATLGFTYDIDASEAPLNGEDVNNMTAQRYNTLTSSWQPPLAGQTSNTTTNSVSVPGVSQMSPWTISKISQPLPVELIEFYATCVDQTAKLIWVTLSELNSDRYEIEKSDNLNNWNYLASILGAGNSATILNYLYTDPTPLEGLSYYRLKQIDFDGNYAYYGPISIFCGYGTQGTFEVTNINVNPQQNEIEIHYKTPLIGIPVNIVMYNTIGQQIINIREYSTDANGMFSVKSENIASGIYLISIKCQQKVFSNKILIH